MKTRTKIITLSGVTALFFWFIDALLGHYVFYHKPFLDLLVFHIPYHCLYVRCVILCCIGVHAVAMLVLLSQRDHAAADLREQRDRVQEYLDVAQVIMMALDRQGNVTLVNRRGCAVLGYTEEEILGKNWFANFLPTDARERTHDTFIRIMNGDLEPVEYYENPVLTKSGGERLIEWHNAALRDETGRIVASLSSGVDVTDRRCAEEARREIEERYRLFVENFPGIAFRGDLDSGPEFFHGAVEEITGYTGMEFTFGKPRWDQVVYPDDAPSLQSRLEKVRSEQDFATETEYRIVRKDGQVRWVREFMRNICDAGGKPCFVQGAIFDVTDRRLAEEEIRRLNEGLEQRVMDRTAQLAAINEELEAFTYSVSHDLRAPLRAIDGFGNAIAEDYGDRLDDEGNDHLRRLRNAARRMSELIDDLLKLSHITRAEMRREPVDLSEIARDVRDDLVALDPARVFRFEITDNLIANADSSLMRQVLVNLLGNAWKFTGLREEARIEFGTTEMDGATVYFVRDNGVGFDPAYTDKLFRAFQRLHSTSEFEGTGIGLAIVRRVIMKHSGRVWAEGIVDQGATFYFTLGDVRSDEDGKPDTAG